MTPEEATSTPDDIQDKSNTDTAPSAESGGTSADVDNWKQSYDELRSKFNERDSELAQLRQFRESLSDPQRQAEILKDFGIHLEDEREEIEEDDVFRDPRVDQLIAEREQERVERQQERAYEAFVGDFTDQVEAVEKTDGRELTDKEIKILYDRAEAALYRGEQSRVEDLYADLKEIRGESQRELIASKKAPRVQSGRSASELPDLDTREQKVKHALEQWALRGQD